MASLTGTVTVDHNHSLNVEGVSGESRWRALARMRTTPWALHRSAWAACLQRVSEMQVGEPLEMELVASAPAVAKAPRLPRAKGTVAVVPVYGVIAQHRGADWWADVYTEEITRQIGAAMQDDRVGAVVGVFDTPGGAVFGVPEAAAVIRGFRGQGKPLYAVGKGMVASAGYWLASAFDKVFLSPSGEIGSIGVWVLHGDESKFWEEMGVDITIVSSGEFKTEGNPFEPLTIEGEAEMQRSTDEYHDMFKRDAALGRGTPVKDVAENYGQGRLLSAEAAKAAGMIDGIATFEEVLAAIMVPRKTRRASALAALAIEEAEG